eukprot:2556138-Prymnesium_polylepis.1
MESGDKGRLREVARCDDAIVKILSLPTHKVERPAGLAVTPAREMLDLSLHFGAARVLLRREVGAAATRLVREIEERVQLGRHLQAEGLIVAEPHTAGARSLVEDRANDALGLERPRLLEPRHHRRR